MKRQLSPAVPQPHQHPELLNAGYLQPTVAANGASMQHMVPYYGKFQFYNIPFIEWAMRRQKAIFFLSEGSIKTCRYYSIQV